MPKWLALPWLVVLGFYLGLLYFQATSAREPSLELAQVRFEQNDSKARMLNWEGFRQNKWLTCRDEPELRICSIEMETVNPLTGARGSRTDVFACSPQACAWVVE